MYKEKDTCTFVYNYSALLKVCTILQSTACEYGQYFDMDCSQFSEQEVDVQSGVEPASMEGAESMDHTLPTSLPHLITGSGEDSDVSLDRPVVRKRISQDSGLSYDRALSEVFSVMDVNDDSGKPVSLSVSLL